MMRIGVFGGTFDPIHYAHLIIGEHIVDQLGLDKILFVPACEPPHKTNWPLSTPSYRLAMILLAVADNLHFEACDLEIVRGGVSYTIDTVRELRKKYNLAARDFYFIMGSDSLKQMHTWREPEKIVRECRVVAVNRPGYIIDSAKEKYAQRVKIVNAPLIEISASTIRNRIKRGKSIRYLTPPAVVEFIKDKKLYIK